jgi:acyl carrier protein
MSITLEIEKWFNIELTREDAAQIETVKDLQDLVFKYRKSQAA